MLAETRRKINKVSLLLIQSGFCSQAQLEGICGLRGSHLGRQAPRKQQSLTGAMNRGTWEVPQPQRAAQARCCLSGFTRQSENSISSTEHQLNVFQHCLYSWDRTFPFWSECHNYLKVTVLTVVLLQGLNSGTASAGNTVIVRLLNWVTQRVCLKDSIQRRDLNRDLFYPVTSSATIGGISASTVFLEERPGLDVYTEELLAFVFPAIGPG